MTDARDRRADAPDPADGPPGDPGQPPRTPLSRPERPAPARPTRSVAGPRRRPGAHAAGRPPRDAEPVRQPYPPPHDPVDPPASAASGDDAPTTALPRRAVPPRPTPPPAAPHPPAAPPRDGAPTVLPTGPERRRRRVARFLSWVAVVTSVAVLAAAGAGYALLQKYDGNIDRIGGVLSLPGVDRPADSPRESTTFLLVGSDSRAGLEAGEGPQGTGADFVTGQRADTIIVAHLFGGSDQAQLVSIPRDAYVSIPAHRNPDTGETVPAHEGKINSSFFAGGPPLLVATVERLAGVRIDHYVQVDFNGFTTMVDRLGGVEVCLSEPAREKDSGIDLPAGRQVIEGEQALAFVRQRKGLPRGDIDRIARQQQFMGAVIRKTLSAGTLLNPLKLNGFLEAATESLQVDENLEIGDLRDLALRMRNASAGAVAFTTVPVADPAGRRNGESVVLLDERGTRELFDRLRRDLPPGAPDPDAPVPDTRPLTVAPEDVTVQVYNGAGISGLGRQVAQDLTGLGFRSAGPAQNREASSTATQVLHGPGQEEAARTVAAAIPGAVVQEDASLARVVEVVAGASYDGVVDVAAPGATARPSAPAATPSPDVLTAADDVCAP